MSLENKQVNLKALISEISDLKIASSERLRYKFLLDSEI